MLSSRGVMMSDIIVIGSSNTDMIVQTPRLPCPGETILGGSFYTAAGGKGANQAVAGARAGGNVTFVGRLGQDMYGDQAIQGLQENGINVDYIIRDKAAASGVALIMVDDQGENCIAVASGANGHLTATDLFGLSHTFKQDSIVLMQLEIPLETVAATASQAQSKGATVILNPAPACSLSKELLSNVTLLTPNETETEMLTGITVKDEASAQQAAVYLVDHGVENIIITLGAAGAYIYSNQYQGMISGFSVSAVDTTAAGDTFNGALAVALAEKQTMKEAVIFANAAAALSVTKLGAQPSTPHRQTIEQFMTGKSNA